MAESGAVFETSSPDGSTRALRTFGLAWLIAFTGAVTPGPMLALVIGQVLAQGFSAVLLILLGHALLEGIFIAGFAFGLMHFLKRTLFRGMLAIVGGVALGWMGIDILVHVPDMSLTGGSQQAMSWLGLLAGGAGVSLANPYFTGWWATVGSGQVATFGLKRPLDFGVFWAGHEMGDIVWYVFVALLLVFGKQWLNDSAYHVLLWICGGVICALAVLFVGLGTRCLLQREAGTESDAG